MYQSTAKQQQKLCICTGIFYAFKKRGRVQEKNPDRLKTILDAIWVAMKLPVTIKMYV